MSLFPRVVAEEAGEYAGRVRVLPEEVAERIAAGEVIERPASAIKELVENSLDAGASRVEIDIESGGMTLIRVSDDGCGMSPGDAELSLKSHATSKLHSADDLSHVSSLGFRGEALHAIASVSLLTLTTREAGSRQARQEQVLAGKPVESSFAGRAPGTTVEVRDLFLNLPVRRGFLGTPRAETNAVASVVEALSLSRPDVGFYLHSGGRGALSLPPAADLRERVARIHGLELAKRLVEVHDEPVRGLVSPLSVSLPTRRCLHVTVNGRVVESDSFAPAVAKAYADLLPKGRHPAAFLGLELDPGEVDVNVHPAKSAVRLKGGRSAYPLVVGAIRAALSLEKEESGGKAALAEDDDLLPIGQFAGRLLLAQRGEELFIIDQHAAHERILYERLSENPERSPVGLSNPQTVQLPAELAREVWVFEAELEALGFRFEPFGPDAVRLTATPDVAQEPERAFLAALEALAGGEDLAKAMACKGSTKFGEGLSKAQMEELLQEWVDCEFPEICPHGRPVVKRTQLSELLKEFGRA